MACIKVEQQNETISRVNQYVTSVLPSMRYEHSLRVAELTRDLCRKFFLDAEAGYLAGIAHDMCKVAKDRLLLSLASRDGILNSSIEIQKPSLLHGRAAAVLLETEFGVTDSSVLNAVRYHTFGSPDLDDLGLILFVADKIEPGRSSISNEYREELMNLSIQDMTRVVLEDNMRYLHSKGKHVSQNTIALLKKLERGTLNEIF